MTSSWFFLSTLNYDARSTTHQKDILGYVHVVGKVSYMYSPYSVVVVVVYLTLCNFINIFTAFTKFLSFFLQIRQRVKGNSG